MSWSVARKCSRRYSSKDIHKYLCCIFYISLQNSSFVAYFVFGNSIRVPDSIKHCLHWIEHSNDKFWIRTLRKGCLGFAESQCRNPQNIQLVLCPQLQNSNIKHIATLCLFTFQSNFDLIEILNWHDTAIISSWKRD